MRKVLHIFSVSIILAGLFFSSSPRVLANSEMVSMQKECLARERKVSILYLVDESRSLKTSDKLNQRLDAIEGSIRSFYSIAKSSNTKSGSGIEIDMKIAGFSGQYIDHMPNEWKAIYSKSEGLIGERSLDDFIQLQVRSGLSNELAYTNYFDALRGAHNALVERQRDSNRCLQLIWFSDGGYNIDNDATTFTQDEIRTIKNDLCGADGIADTIRKSGIHVSSVGLSDGGRQAMGLMELIASGKGEFPVTAKTGGAKFTQTNCGEVAANGDYLSASNADDLIASFISSVPEAPSQKARLEPCNNPNLECRQLSFFVSTAMRSFKLLLKVGDPEQKVVLQSPDAEKTHELFPPKPESGLDINLLGSVNPLIEKSRVGNERWSGLWTITFEGRAADKSVASVRFIGDVKVDVDTQDAKGKSRIEFDSVKPIKIKLSQIAQPSDELEDVGVSVSAGGRMLKADRQGPQDFLIPPDEIKSLISSGGQFENAGSLSLEMIPTALVDGIKGENGESIPVEFDPYQFIFTVSSGDTYPTCQVTGENKIKGKESLTVSLSCDGPKSGNGELRIEDVVVPNPGNFGGAFKLSEKKLCEFTEGETDVECQFTIEPTSDFYETLFLEILGSISGTNTIDGSEKAVVYPLEIQMSRDPNPTRGWLWFVGLVSLFLFIQGIMRLTFALAASRFEALEVNYRKALLQVSVWRDSNGRFELTRNGSRLSARSEETSFATELEKPTSKVEVGNFRLHASWKKTFMSINHSPIGMASNEGSVTFGSAGVSSGRDRSVKGLVNLALGGQWALSISPESLTSLQNSGAKSAEGFLLVFLRPIENLGQSLDEQMREVSNELSVLLSEQIDKVQTSSDESAVGDDQPANQDDFGSGNTALEDDFGGAFGASYSSSAMSSEPLKDKKSKSKRRKAKESEKDSDEDGFENATSNSVNSDDDFGGAFA